jgi:hypothetical protein
MQAHTNILTLTESSRASEVAKEKGSMVDIHLPRLVIVGEGIPEARWGSLTGADHRWSVLPPGRDNRRMRIEILGRDHQLHHPSRV